MTKIPAKRLDKQAHISLVLRAAESAKSVLSQFEVRHPRDDRPRRAIEAGRAWARGELAMTKARTAAFAAHAAAREAGHPAARFAARAAGQAATTAHVTGHASHADAYAAKPVWSRLVYPTETNIRRYVKVRAEANPLDPQWHDYFEDRAFFKKFGIHRREAGLSKSG